VVCNDGWVNSSVYFSDAEECQNIQKCPRYYPDGQYQELKTKVEVQIQSTRDDWQKTCDEGFQRMENNNIKSYEICTRYNQGRTTSYISAGGMGQPSGLMDCAGERNTTTQTNENARQLCLRNADQTVYKYQDLLSCMRPESEQFAIFEAYCKSSLPGSIYEWWSNKCICVEGDEYTLTGTGSARCQKVSSVSVPSVKNPAEMTQEEIKRDIVEIAEQVRREYGTKETSVVEQQTLTWEKLNKKAAQQTKQAASDQLVPEVKRETLWFSPTHQDVASSTGTTTVSVVEIIKPKASIFARYQNWSKKTGAKLWSYFFGPSTLIYNGHK